MHLFSGEWFVGKQNEKRFQIIHMFSLEWRQFNNWWLMYIFSYPSWSTNERTNGWKQNKLFTNYLFYFFFFLFLTQSNEQQKKKMTFVNSFVIRWFKGKRDPYDRRIFPNLLFLILAENRERVSENK